MSYQVLARKWRPQSFDDVTGQAPVVKTLQRALETGRIAHAFLFTGSRGIGKTTLARLLAKALSCETGVTPTPCGECANCVEIAEGKSIDIVEIDGASNTGVDDVRELREVARFMPQKARFKIFIIDEVHMLSTGAFNALLKTLEEPPEHVKFIFATTEAHKIPVTILSRCQRYDFKRITTDAIVGRLKEVLDAEGAKFDDGALTLLARAAEGGMRDALSLADQVLSFAGMEADADAVTNALGLIDRRSVMRLVFAALDQDARVCLEVSAEAFARGHDVKQLADSLTQELRNLAVAKATGSVAGFADIAPEDADEVDERARAAESRDLQRLFYMALDGSDLVQRADNPRLALELILLRMCDRPPLGEAAAISDAITRLEAMARGKPVPPPQASAGPAMQIARAATGGAREQRSAPQAQDAPPAEEADPHPAPAAPAASSAPPAPPPQDDPAPPALSEPPPQAPLPDEAPPPAWGLDQALDQVGERRAPAPEPEPEDDDEDEEPPFDPALGYLLEGVDPRFVDVVRDVAPTSKRLASLLAHAHVIEQEGDELRVSFSRNPHTEEVRGHAASKAVKDALANRFGAGTRLVIVEHEEGKGAPSVAQAQRRAAEQAQADLEAHARAHPVVQAAMELFGGEVRSVRRE
jgi:DNA polymerase-3 subunit gamma/tau